ncbi:hypothetical protein ARMGADRAFT_1012625 [Armillaria gallica]|uniref:F-box domain-containing protein n=1 Tax=Armillaria gallica TaxID=47427 RepID=A0A2H3DCG9_ARMGA|nr:hypothetical protein ARMGADRAFT_1012625 [Armillaria gallica]
MAAQNANGDDLPFELVEEIIENIRDDMASLRVSSRVSKAWRTASLRHLFSVADFSLEKDFTRWRDIGASMAHVPLYVQKVNFEPGGRFREKRIQDLKAKYPGENNKTDIMLEFLWQEHEHQAPPPNVRLPLMPRATKFLWSNMMTDPIRWTSQTKRFLSTFPAVTELEFQGMFLSTVEAKQFLSMFKHIQSFTTTSIDIESVSANAGVFTGDMTDLRILSLQDCRMSADWLVDEVFEKSRPTRLQHISYEFDMPFSPKTFIRLLDMAADSLEDMSLQPPSPGHIGWTKLPPFKKRAFPSLRSLKFAVISLGASPQPLFQLTWCAAALQLFPAALGLTTLSIHVFADESRELTDILKQSFPFKWNLFAEVVLRVYPNLKKFVIIISMQYNFGKKTMEKSELSVKRVLKGLGERVRIEWVDEGPKPQDP